MFGNRTHREGWGGIYGAGINDNPSFTNNNRQTRLSYDLAGNYTAGGVMTYDATSQQIASSASLTNAYDGDRLRGKKTESTVATYYLRSSVLGGQVVCEINASGGWSRGYVYLGGQLIAIQSGGVNWVHQEPITKGQRITDINGNVTTTVELDPFGGETDRSVNSAFQRHKYTSYDRDANQSDDAMNRRYNRWWSRFDQPDPYDGSYDSGDPQSFNRYAYVQNDPVNFVDPSGLDDLPVIPPSDVTIPISFLSPIDTSGGRRGGGIRPRPILPLDPPGPRDNPRLQKPKPQEPLPTPKPEPPPTPTPDPCNSPETWNMRLNDFRQLGSSIGFDFANDGTPKDRRNNSFNQVRKDLEWAGFWEFLNLDFIDHPGGFDFEGRINGRWYHATIYPSTRRQSKSNPRRLVDFNLPVRKLEIHCETNFARPQTHYFQTDLKGQ